MLLAKELIEIAANAGANAVKFQTFSAEELLLENSPKANYQMLRAPIEETQYNMLKQLELSEKNHFDLFQHAIKNNIQFLSTPFDFQSLKLLNEKLKLPLFKVASGEITNAPFYGSSENLKTYHSFHRQNFIRRNETPSQFCFWLS